MLSKWFCISINTHPFHKKRCREEIKHNYTWDHFFTLENTTFSSCLFLSIALLLIYYCSHRCCCSNTAVNVQPSFSENEMTWILFANYMNQTWKFIENSTGVSLCCGTDRGKSSTPPVALHSSGAANKHTEWAPCPPPPSLVAHL